MSKSLRNRFLVIGAFVLAAIAFIWPIDKRINLGLDLKGGMHLVLKVDTEQLDENAKKDAVERAMEILRNRIDSLGVGETVVQRQGQEEILVQLPGVTDRDQAVAMVKRVAHLEFKLVESDQNKLREAMNGEVPKGYELKLTKEDSPEQILLVAESVLKGDAIKDAKVDFNQGSFYPNISLTLTPEGTKDFAKLTRENVGRRLAIVLDNEVISAPNIREPITTGTAEISGQFKFDEASILSMALRSGSLPAPMHIEEERTIGPLLGKDSIDSGLRATLIGGLGVFFFMIAYYVIGGVIASFGLFLNILMLFGAMAFINLMLPLSQLTLTLPGIAGIALTLGMAVDANVLINERIREEMDNGRPIRASINAGYERALSAIVDTNLTTLIAAFLLFYFGSGPIKGFAVTLSLGLVVSLFTSVYFTRTIFLFLLEKDWIKSAPMMRFVGKTNINFINKAVFLIPISLLIIVAGIHSMMQKGDQAYGIDFSGGQVQEYLFDRPVEADALREALKNAGLGDAVIQQFEKNKKNVIVRTSTDSYETVQNTLKIDFPDNSFEVLRIEKVGPVVGKHLRKQALLAMLFALLGIMGYVGFRFKHWDFGIAGVLALLHDVLFAMGALVLLGRQIDLLVVTGLLTIAGYSINDTIVIYDRVRENMLAQGRKMSLTDVINLSVNQSLARTLITSLTTLIIVFSFFFLGGEVLNTFSLTLLIGLVVGTYSSMFIVSPIVVWVQRFMKKS